MSTLDHPVTSAARRPSRAILADEVYEAIKARLMDDEIAPGSRLNIDALSRELDVSPTPVREGLARLEAEGLVTKKALVGYRVSPPLDDAAVNGLFEVRMILEPAAAALAAERATDREKAEIRAVITGMPQFAPGDTYAAYREIVNLDAAFHEAIAAASANPLLKDSIARLRSHVHLYRLSFQAGFEVSSLAEHNHIYEAVANSDPLAAEKAMNVHLRRARGRLLPGTPGSAVAATSSRT